MPSLTDAPTDKANKGTPNIRRTWLSDWRDYLGEKHRCLVPINMFSEAV